MPKQAFRHRATNIICDYVDCYASIFQSGIVAIWIVTGAKNWQAKE